MKMKGLKRLASLALSAAMAVGMVLPAHAMRVQHNITAMGPNGNINVSEGGKVNWTPWPGHDGTITVEQPGAVGATYTVYQLFAANIDDSTGQKTVSYTINDNSPWYEFVTEGEGKNYVTIGGIVRQEYVKNEDGTDKTETVDNEDGTTSEVKVVDYTTYSVTWKDGVNEDSATAQTFAQTALKYIEGVLSGNSDMADESTGGDTDTETKNLYMVFGSKSAEADPLTGRPQAVQFTGVPLGYYLVDSSMGSLCSLNTTQYNASIEDKNVAPTVEKQVWEDRYSQTPTTFTGDNVGWGKTNDADMFETVWFRSIISTGAGTENLVLYDAMYPGLTLNEGSFKVYLNGNEIVNDKDAEGNPTGSHWTVDVNPNWGVVADSTIRDTDMADEMVDYDKNNGSNQGNQGVLLQSDEIEIPDEGNEIEPYAMISSGNMTTTDKNLEKLSSGYKINHAAGTKPGANLAASAGCTFTVNFTDKVLGELKANDKLIVVYTAFLNKDAAISPIGNDNIAIVGYGVGTGVGNVLQQAGQSMLAQANQTNQSVLSQLQNGGDIDVGAATEEEQNWTAPQSDKLSSGFKDDAAGLAISVRTKGNAFFSNPSVTTTYTYQMDLVKIDGGNNVLSGATFALFKEGSTTPVPMVAYTKPNVEWSGWNPQGVLGSSNQVPQNVLQLLGSEGEELDPSAEVGLKDLILALRPATDAEIKAWQDGTSTLEIIQEFPAGIVAIVGLDHGEYHLVETNAPDGFNALKDPVDFQVVSTLKSGSDRELFGTATLTIGEKAGIPMTATIYKNEKATNGYACFASEGGMVIVNNMGGELPSTGGMGTTIFYTVGALLVLSAGILLVVKKRMSA